MSPWNNFQATKKAEGDKFIQVWGDRFKLTYAVLYLTQVHVHVNLSK